jgi:hypothetical protein
MGLVAVSSLTATEFNVAKATAHPDRRLIWSEDGPGNSGLRRAGDEEIGEVDHLLIEKVSGRVAYAVISFGGFLGLAHSHYPTLRNRSLPWSSSKTQLRTVRKLSRQRPRKKQRKSRSTRPTIQTATNALGARFGAPPLAMTEGGTLE